MQTVLKAEMFLVIYTERKQELIYFTIGILYTRHLTSCDGIRIFNRFKEPSPHYLAIELQFLHFIKHNYRPNNFPIKIFYGRYCCLRKCAIFAIFID